MTCDDATGATRQNAETLCTDGDAVAANAGKHRPHSFRSRLRRRPFTAGILDHTEDHRNSSPCAPPSFDAHDTVPELGAAQEPDLDRTPTVAGLSNGHARSSVRQVAYRSPHEAYSIQRSNAAVVRRVAERISHHCAPSHNWQTRRQELEDSIRAALPCPTACHLKLGGCHRLTVLPCT
jgi:hypothetical protein